MVGVERDVVGLQFEVVFRGLGDGRVPLHAVPGLLCRRDLVLDSVCGGGGRCHEWWVVGEG